jgi:L-malate glycosyltransferase
MNKKMVFRIFYPDLKNVDLVKESGMIANYLSLNFNYDAGLITLPNEDFSNLALLNKEVRLHIINGFFKNQFFNSILYLVKNSSKIDIIQFIHLSKQSVFFSIIYKLLNPKGFIYIKLDTSERLLKHVLMDKSIKGLFRKFVINNVIDLVSTELTKIYERLEHNWGPLKNKLIYLPNGITVNEDLRRKKEKIIITSGRIGDFEKATDILLKSLETCKLEEDWKVYLIGPVEQEFNAYLDEWYKQNPNLKDKVITTGPINNRQELYEFYSKAAIFCFPSRSECFSFALLEAVYFGCYLVLTPVGSAGDLLKITNYGEIVEVDNYQELSKALENAMKTWKYDEKLVNKIREDITKSFSWEIVCFKLDYNIKQRLIAGNK